MQWRFVTTSLVCGLLVAMAGCSAVLPGDQEEGANRPGATGGNGQGNPTDDGATTPLEPSGAGGSSASDPVNPVPSQSPGAEETEEADGSGESSIDDATSEPGDDAPELLSPTGACCLPFDACMAVDGATCGTLQGRFLGDDTICELCSLTSAEIAALLQDSDGDGLPNEVDPDVDGDGLLNVQDGDIDGDGVPNTSDDDIDGDGIPNERDNDADGDGLDDDDPADEDGGAGPDEDEEDSGDEGGTP